MFSDGGKYQTLLTRFVDARWRVRGWSQAKFVDWLFDDQLPDGFGQQTLSKFIRGRLSAVPAGLIDALSKKFDVPTSELEDMAVTPAKAHKASESLKHTKNQPELRFVLGHTVWAASFLVAMLNQDIRDKGLHTEGGIELASRKKDGDHDDGEKYAAMDWYKDDGPSPNRDDYPIPLSAPGVTAFLESTEVNPAEGNTVTFGILPWEVAVERNEQGCSGRYIRLATLMDSVAACSIVVPTGSKIKSSGQIGSNVVNSETLVRDLVGDTRPRQIILAEQGTLAGEQAARIADLASEMARSQGIRREIVWEHVPTSDLAKQRWEEFTTNYKEELAAIITWDPHATRLAQLSDGSALRYSLVDVHGKQGGPDQVTFDIVLFLHEMAEHGTDYAAWRQLAVKAARRLFSEILPSVQDWQKPLSNLARGKRDAIEILTEYFDFAKFALSSQEIARLFSNIRYAVSIDPQGMKEIMDMEE